MTETGWGEEGDKEGMTETVVGRGGRQGRNDRDSGNQQVFNMKRDRGARQKTEAGKETKRWT